MLQLHSRTCLLSSSSSSFSSSISPRNPTPTHQSLFPFSRFYRSSNHHTNTNTLLINPNATHNSYTNLNNPSSSSVGPVEEEEIEIEIGEVEIEIEEIGKNRRRIRSKVNNVNATLQTVWDILTDYHNLANYFPNLAVSQLLLKDHNFARLFQVGEQNLAFGLKFNAKGTVDCFEKDLEVLPNGLKRDIEFNMIEGDFQLFQGKWSIQQYNSGKCEHSDALLHQEFHTTVSYVVDVEPKLWLPVRLVEGRLCREITTNLSSIRNEAQKANYDTSSTL